MVRLGKRSAQAEQRLLAAVNTVFATTSRGGEQHQQIAKSLHVSRGLQDLRAA